MIVNKSTVNSILEGASVFAVGLITGANVYISGFEVAGRDDSTPPSYQLQNWQQMVPRARDVLKPFGIAVNGIMGVVLYRTRKPMWWVPFGLLFALGPWTAIAIVPTNEKLAALSPGNSTDEEQAPALVRKWGSLHLVRTVLSTAGFIGAIVAMAASSN